ncbi:MAG: transglutaminase-like domain-containing protein [Acidobacteriota bacterium]
MKGRIGALSLCALALSGALPGGEQSAVYRASGADARLFDQYDNDGYSLAVVPLENGVELRVRVSDAPLESTAPFPTGLRRETSLTPAPDRDAFAARLARGSRTSAEAVRRVLVEVASEIRYDPDRLRNQDPAAVFASRRAYCVGYSELAVDLLRRLSIRARTVQGVLRSEPGADRYDPAIEGVYHRWIEVFYPDRGFVFSDPAGSINGVDARYLPFDRRSLTRPRSLHLKGVEPPTGSLAYEAVVAGKTRVRIRK